MRTRLPYDSQGNTLTFTSCVLGLKVCTTAPGLSVFLFYGNWCFTCLYICLPFACLVPMEVASSVK